MAKNKSKRVPMTANLFMDYFKNLPPDMRMFAISFFAMEEDEALHNIDDFAAGIMEEPDQPGKQGALEGLQHLRAAWTKMSIPERFWLRRKIKDPKFLIKYFTPNELVELVKDFGNSL